jgi:Fic family protein
MLSESLQRKIATKQEELEQLKPLSDKAKIDLEKKFRLEFNYNSNHLEGNTLTYTETELLLFFEQIEGAHDYRELIEMKAHDAALKMIEDEAADLERPLTEGFIRTLNETILVKPFWKNAITISGHDTRKHIVPGQYKETPNSVKLVSGEIFHYTAPSDVSKEMSELIEWYNNNLDKSSPLELAALFHYKFVRIHPFDDGNGRTARLVMNYILMRFKLPIVIIKSGEKKDYLSALHKADAGDIPSFVNYIGSLILWSFNISIKAAKGQSVEEEDDLDKELDLLLKDLKQIPDEFENKKSVKEVSYIFQNSALALMIDLDDKISKVKSLFVETKISMTTSELVGSLREPMEYLVSIESAREMVTNDSDSYEDLIESITIEITLSALKKVVEPTDLFYNLYFTFEDYHYKLKDTTEDEYIYKIPYGRSLTNDQRNKVVKEIMRAIVEDVKSVINIK